MMIFKDMLNKVSTALYKLDDPKGAIVAGSFSLLNHPIVEQVTEACVGTSFGRALFDFIDAQWF